MTVTNDNFQVDREYLDQYLLTYILIRQAIVPQPQTIFLALYVTNIWCDFALTVSHR